MTQMGTTDSLGRFGHHPNPAVDFEIEVQSLGARLFDAAHGISKPGTEPETVEAVRDAIERAMSFRVGGDPSAVRAKDALRELQARATTERVSEPVEIGYTNWRGEYAVRKIIPIRPWFGFTEWHPEPQWLLRAIDVEKGAERDFAIKDIGFRALAVPDGWREAMEAVGHILEERAAYFDRTKGHFDREDAARSYRATAKEIAALAAPTPPEEPKP